MPRTKSHRLLEEKRKAAQSHKQEPQKPVETRVLDDETINPFGVAPDNAVVDEDAIAKKVTDQVTAQLSDLLESAITQNQPKPKPEKEYGKSHFYLVLGLTLVGLFIGRGLIRAMDEVQATNSSQAIESAIETPSTAVTPTNPPILSDTQKAAKSMGDLNDRAVIARADYLYQKAQNQDDPVLWLKQHQRDVGLEFLVFAQANPQVTGEADQNNRLTELTRELEAVYLAQVWAEIGYPQNPKTVDLTKFRQN